LSNRGVAANPEGRRLGMAGWGATSLLKRTASIALIGLLVLLIAGPGCQSGDTESKASVDPNSIAVVLGTGIARSEADDMTGIILGKLTDQFIEEHRLKASDAEVDAFLGAMKRFRAQDEIDWEERRAEMLEELKSPSLDEHDRRITQAQLETLESNMQTSRELEVQREGPDSEKLEEFERRFASSTVTRWKMHRELYKKYGGRVIFQQFGNEPVDAYRDFLREKEAEGAFEILDKKYEEEFWDYFVNDGSHMFISEEAGEEAMTTPWWLAETRSD